MLSPRWRKVINDLWANKTRTILVLLSISIGVSAIGMVMTSQTIVDESLPETYAAVQPASGTIFTLNTFTDSMVEAIESMAEVGEAEGRRSVNVRFLAKIKPLVQKKLGIGMRRIKSWRDAFVMLSAHCPALQTGYFFDDLGNLFTLFWIHNPSPVSVKISVGEHIESTT